MERNPYFGIGLSVHEFTNDCNRCGHVEFVPERPTIADEQRSSRVQRSVPNSGIGAVWRRMTKRR